MRRDALSRWLLLALLLDTLLAGLRFWAIASEVVHLLPYRTATDWAREPDLLLLMVLLVAGLIGIVMAFDGECRPLFLWNVCYLAVVVAANFSFGMDIASIISRFTIERSMLIATPTLAVIALCMDEKKTTVLARCEPPSRSIN